jgi:hypothetical protein
VPRGVCSAAPLRRKSAAARTTTVQRSRRVVVTSAARFCGLPAPAEVFVQRHGFFPTGARPGNLPVREPYDTATSESGMLFALKELCNFDKPEAFER